MIDLDALLKRALHARNEQLEMGMRPAQVLDLIHLARAAADSLPKIKEGAADEAFREAVIHGTALVQGGKVVPQSEWRAPASQAAAPDDNLALGLARAAQYLEKEAADYIEKNASTEHDTGATVFYQGESGREHHSLLIELAEEIRALAGAAPVEAASPWQRFSYPTKPGVYLVALDPGLHGLRTDRAMEAQYGELTNGWTVRECGVVVHVTGYVKAWMELPAIPAAPAPEAQ